MPTLKAKRTKRLNLRMTAADKRLFETAASRQHTDVNHFVLESARARARSSRILRRSGLDARQRLEWVEDGEVVCVLPVAKDPIAAFRGSSPKGVTKALLASRRNDSTKW